MYIEFDSELRKIGSQAKKIVLKDFAGKFGALFFIWFGYKIDAPIYITSNSYFRLIPYSLFTVSSHCVFFVGAISWTRCFLRASRPKFWGVNTMIQ